MGKAIDLEDFKAAMGSFAAGVTLVTTLDAEGKPYGLTATAFSSVDPTPPTCLVCVAHDAEACPVIASTARFAVNVLGAEQEALSNRFATKGADKFAHGLAWQQAPETGAPFVQGAIAQIECSLLASHTQGGHEIFIGRVLGARVSEGAPLLHWRGRYGRLMEG